MTKDEIIKNLTDLIYATDEQGYPLPAHVKIARLQIFIEKQTNIKNKGVKND